MPTLSSQVTLMRRRSVLHCSSSSRLEWCLCVCARSVLQPQPFYALITVILCADTLSTSCLLVRVFHPSIPYVCLSVCHTQIPHTQTHANPMCLHLPSLWQCPSMLLCVRYLQKRLPIISNWRLLVVQFLLRYLSSRHISLSFPPTYPSRIQLHLHPADCFTVWICPLGYVGFLVPLHSFHWVRVIISSCHATPAKIGWTWERWVSGTKWYSSYRLAWQHSSYHSKMSSCS